ncbi:MAG: SDR family NAD(P)-dependent oxidoreductase [Lachnospiraceae bacterium]|nr:SDR family NAD(P)-dependent oxidoreductase [Lachnospiraceae bacterium]MCI1424506.1 SDR family NAD(P)-dependent oxidoreductase [Lachnospiraceae bacterium]MCI1453138.1 SDR family NAD(P)-dependent oxidoreductase [Lachnospiraceae bacterium]
MARRKDRLEEWKFEIENSYGVRVTAIVKDLSREEAAREIYGELQEKKIAVDQMVNNAGAGKMGRVVDADPETMQALLHLNVVSVTLLGRYFGRDMEERGRGRILNVSSMGAFLPDPWSNVYGPTKAYERFLTETMYGERKGENATVTARCPGPTKTGWARNAKFAKNLDEVAREGFIAMQRGELVCIPDADYRAIRCLAAHLPAACQADLIGRWQKSLIGQE